jgi:hypothetical protein
MIADTSFPNIRKRIGETTKKAKAEIHFEVSRLSTGGAGIPHFLAVAERTFKVDGKPMQVDNVQTIIGEADGATRVAGSKRKAAPKDASVPKKQKAAADQPSELPEEPAAAAPKKSPFAPTADLKPKKSASK